MCSAKAGLNCLYHLHASDMLFVCLLTFLIQRLVNQQTGLVGALQTASHCFRPRQAWTSPDAGKPRSSELGGLQLQLKGGKGVRAEAEAARGEITANQKKKRLTLGFSSPQQRCGSEELIAAGHETSWSQKSVSNLLIRCVLLFRRK